MPTIFELVGDLSVVRCFVGGQALTVARQASNRLAGGLSCGCAIVAPPRFLDVLRNNIISPQKYPTTAALHRAASRRMEDRVDESSETFLGTRPLRP